MGASRVPVATPLARLLLAAVLVATIVLLGARTASASPRPEGARPIGNVSCVASGSLSFIPALTPTGVRGSEEKVTLTERLTGCRGNRASHVPSSPQSVKTGPITLPATTVGTGKVVGDCQVLATQLSRASGRQTITWGARFNKQAFTLTSRLLEQEGIFYFFQHGDGKHTLNVALGLAAASSRSLESCIQGTGGPVGRLVFNRTISSMTEGTTVLTTGRVGGTSVTVGDLLSSRVVGGPACTSASALASVGFNPAVAGTATLRLTSLTFSGCTIDMGPGIGTLPATIAADGLPAVLSLRDGSGDPATLDVMRLTFSMSGGASSCAYASAASLTGTYENASGSITFSGSLALSGGTGPLAANCPSSPLAVPTFTAVTDASRSGSPAVFVN